MISGGRCKVNTLTFENDMTSFKSRDDVITVLIHLGYLAYDQDRKEAYVPNEEVRMAFENTISNTDWTPVIDAINKSERLLKLTWAKEADEVAEYISEVHMQNTSILHYNDENSLSCVITLAYYNAVNDYTVIRELPSGLGYADIVYLPKKHSDKPAMIVELKYNKNAKAAIEQIKEKKYPKSLQDYKGNLLLVGINYDKDTKEHSCIIEDYEI
jgi:ribosomal protein S8